MPLFEFDSDGDPFSGPQRFIIFYASKVNGEMWCPDCRRVEGFVKETFSDTGPDGLIVYVGTRSEWKSLGNKYRQDPWKITNVPTIVKVENGSEVGRLGDHHEIEERLVTFVQS